MVTVISKKKDEQKHEKDQIGWRVNKINGIEFKDEIKYGWKLEDKQQIYFIVERVRDI